MKEAGINRPPDYIVVMGGGGMPSESGLMRCWYAAKAGNYYTRAKIIIALPGKAEDSASSVNEMKNELIFRQIEPGRIILEDSGTNTRSQSLLIRERFDTLESPHNQPAILIVTSPEHLYRAIKAFRKAGFKRVDGFPAFESNIESDIRFAGKKIGRKKFVPEIGNNLAIRYNFWTQLRYEMILMREYLAILYYEVNGWM